MTADINNKKTFGVVLLAAGASSRLGRPKQLLAFDGKILLHHTLQVACASKADPIAIVLGANADIIKENIDSKGAHVVINESWQEGMASSIRLGITTLLELNPAIEGAILMVCDQPYISVHIIDELIATHHRTGKDIVTCGYADTFGPPTLFHKIRFPELILLIGDTGARSILKQHAEEVELVLFPEGKVDIDTEADYERLKN